MKLGFGSVAARSQCGLCGKDKAQVRKMIVGLQGAVCSDCIDLCIDILGGRNPDLPLMQELPGAFSVEIPEKLAQTFRSPDEVIEALAMLSLFIERKSSELGSDG